jgi:hypothetical protein
MSATSSHGEELATSARKDHVFAVDLPLNHSAVRKAVNREPVPEIWSCKVFHDFASRLLSNGCLDPLLRSGKVTVPPYLTFQSALPSLQRGFNAR